jgi:hypothetical protein
MLALLNDVPVLGHPVFRILLGVALIAVAVLLLHNSIILIAIGALILIMGLTRGARALTGRAQKGELS